MKNNFASYGMRTPDMVDQNMVIYGGTVFRLMHFDLVKGILVRFEKRTVFQPNDDRSPNFLHLKTSTLNFLQMLLYTSKCLDKLLQNKKLD